jgi:putative ABC transport system substrate-binding protein
MATWALAARAQQQAMPVVGFLSAGSPEGYRELVAAFRKGLSEMGYEEGRNLTIEYRYGQNQRERLPDLAADLVRRRIAVLAAMPNPAALAAKAATSSIPIVFYAGGDAVEAGLVKSLNQPDGNLTGINSVNVRLGPKRVGLLHELLPRATRFGLLVYPDSPSLEINIRDAHAAAASIAGSVEVLSARTNREIDAAFFDLVEKRIEALIVMPSTFFFNRRVQLANLAARHAMPTIYPAREFAEGGGLISYAPNIPDQLRQVGIYVGRILKGEKPAELPVMQPTKFELVINLQTARLLDLAIPPTLLAIADEVIE